MNCSRQSDTRRGGRRVCAYLGVAAALVMMAAPASANAFVYAQIAYNNMWHQTFTTSGGVSCSTNIYGGTYVNGGELSAADVSEVGRGSIVNCSSPVAQIDVKITACWRSLHDARVPLLFSGGTCDESPMWTGGFTGSQAYCTDSSQCHNLSSRPALRWNSYLIVGWVTLYAPAGQTWTSIPNSEWCGTWSTIAQCQVYAGDVTAS